MNNNTRERRGWCSGQHGGRVQHPFGAGMVYIWYPSWIVDSRTLMSVPSQCGTWTNKLTLTVTTTDLSAGIER